MTHAKDVVSRHIVSADDSRLGRVTSVLVDPVRLEVAALGARPGWFRGEQFLPMACIVELRSDMVLVAAGAALTAADAWRRERPDAVDVRTLHDRPVVSTDGIRIGVLTDLIVDGKTGRVLDLEVGHDHAGVRTRWSRVPCHTGVTVGRDALVVSPAGPEAGIETTEVLL